MESWTNPTVFVIDPDPETVPRLEDLFSSVRIHAVYFRQVEACLERLGPESCGCIVADADSAQARELLLNSRLRETGARLPVIYLSSATDVDTAVALLKAGAMDLLEKPFHSQTLLDAVQEALALSQHQARRRRKQELLWRRFAELTPREWDVLPLMVLGRPNRAIAAALRVSEKTVEAHRNRILRKTGASNLSELIRLAIRVDLLGRLAGQTAPTTSGKPPR